MAEHVAIIHQYIGRPYVLLYLRYAPAAAERCARCRRLIWGQGEDGVGSLQPIEDGLRALLDDMHQHQHLALKSMPVSPPPGTVESEV